METEKQLTVWEAACIITGYGVGGGIMALPYLADKNGLPLAILILLVAFAASCLLHVMIADIVLKSGGKSQIVEVFSHFLFTGKHKKLSTAVCFVILGLVLITNLAAYISGAGEIICGMLGISLFWAELIFYVVAAIVVLFGLKAVGVSEKIAVDILLIVIGVLAVFSVFKWHNPINIRPEGFNQALTYFGLVMFAFGAFFSVPQAVKGLGGDVPKIRKAVFLGLFNNLLLILVITLCVLGASDGITELAMIGWSRGIGVWAQIVGSVFTVLAMLTTYWSISLALADIVDEQLHWDRRLCWIIATLPSLLLVLLGFGGFLDFMRTAGGLIAIIIALMVVPTYRKSRAVEAPSILGDRGGTLLQIITLVAYVLMAVGNVVPY